LKEFNGHDVYSVLECLLLSQEYNQKPILWLSSLVIFSVSCNQDNGQEKTAEVNPSYVKSKGKKRMDDSFEEEMYK
jgi:hypothetical protein